METHEIEIRRKSLLAAAFAAVALVLAVLFLVRGGGWIALGLLLLIVAVGEAWAAYDARTPLLVLDPHGVRIRLAGTWRGLPWSAVGELEHTPRPAGLPGWWHDGRLAVLPVDEPAEVAELSGLAALHARVTQRLYGVPFAVPLGLATQVAGAEPGALTEALARLAGPTTTVVEIDESLASAQPDAPGASTGPETPGADRSAVEDTAPRLPRITEPLTTQPPAVAPTPTPSPLRDIGSRIRVDLDLEAERHRDDDPPVQGALALAPDPRDAAETTTVVLPEADELRRTPVEEWEEALPGPQIVPAPDPVIGPELIAARERLRLSIDQVAERTRIRPHVIEAIEVDDFAPCGGDFYARGHLRTLARVLGVEAAPLLAAYAERYADAPVDPRAVFQAELASADAGVLRRMRGGSNWSVLVAAVMAVVLVWSVARLVTAGTSSHPAQQGMTLQSSSYGADPYSATAAPVKVTVRAAGGGTHVVIRDSGNAVVFTGNLAFGTSKTFQVSPPLRIQTSDGSLTVSVAGSPATAIGVSGQPAQKTYTAP